MAGFFNVEFEPTVLETFETEIWNVNATKKNLPGKNRVGKYTDAMSLRLSNLTRPIFQVDDAEQTVDNQTALIARSWSKLGWHLGDIVAPETSTKVAKNQSPKTGHKFPGECERLLP